VLGNVFRQPLDEVWNGERYRAWRTALLSELSPLIEAQLPPSLSQRRH